MKTQKNLNARQQRWLMHISCFNFKIEYQPGANNFLVDLSRIHVGTPGPLDISLKDPTIDYDSLELPDSTQVLQINTGSPFSADFSIESDDTMYHSGEAQPIPPSPAVTLSVVATLIPSWTRLPALQLLALTNVMSLLPR